MGESGRRRPCMPLKPVTCRHCGEPFISKPGKPGYVDECPECLHAKTAVPKPIEARIVEILGAMTNAKARTKAMRALKRSLLDLGVEESAADKFILSSVEVIAGLREQQKLS
jgi:hypothetical protein